MKRISFASVLMLFLLLTSFSAQAQTLKNKVIAHRGAWKEAGLPENSIAALQRAIQLNCGGSEFDVWMTKDGEVVVNHDPDFKGMPIEHSTYTELLTLKLENGENIPTLRAYLKEGLKQLKKASPDQSTKLILEIKTSQLSKQRTLELTSACVALVKELEAQPLVDYICFDYDAGLKVLELDPEAQVSFLSSNAETPPAKLKKDGYTGFDYHFSVMKSNPEFVQQAQALGLTSNAWTVNQEKDMEEMLELNLDFITTDMPAFLLKKIQ